MLDLSTTYLGFTLPHPLMPGASPMVDDLDTVKRLEDAGAAAIVMHSLFEEQITSGDLGEGTPAPAGATLPDPHDFALAPDRYLEHVQRIKTTVGVPVIASINGTKRGAWLRYARQIQDAGADALELNFYHVPTDTRESGAETERRLLDLVRHLKWTVTIPVAVKLSPFYSSLPHLARELDAIGVDGLVLFNRFFQPDVDPEMLVTALLNHGPQYLLRMRRDLEHWLEQHEYESLREAQGCVSLARSAEPEAIARGNYLRILQTWRPAAGEHHGR